MLVHCASDKMASENLSNFETVYAPVQTCWSKPVRCFSSTICPWSGFIDQKAHASVVHKDILKSDLDSISWSWITPLVETGTRTQKMKIVWILTNPNAKVIRNLLQPWCAYPRTLISGRFISHVWSIKVKSRRQSVCFRNCVSTFCF